MKALVGPGFLRAWTPRVFGGWELSASEGVRLFEAIARVDSSAGWIVANCCDIVTASQPLPDEGAAEVLSDPAAVIVGGLFPPGVAVPTDNGYLISGKWNFMSACHHGTWQVGAAVVLDAEGNPTIAPSGEPSLIVFWVEAKDGTIRDNWDTLGMRGTGSHDVELNQVFIPFRRITPLGPIHPGSAFGGSLYGLHTWIAAPTIAVVALGIGSSALDEAIELASRKTPNFTASALAARPVAQDRLARAKARIDASRCYLHCALDDLQAHIAGGGALSRERAASPLARWRATSPRWRAAPRGRCRSPDGPQHYR
jgi:alkylation response protein AidB-like acyl-CoA dehydrogenase